MKKNKQWAAEIAKSLAEKELRQNANMTTCVVLYQPKVPAALKKFKRDRR